MHLSCYRRQETYLRFVGPRIAPWCQPEDAFSVARSRWLSRAQGPYRSTLRGLTVEQNVRPRRCRRAMLLRRWLLMQAAPLPLPGLSISFGTKAGPHDRRTDMTAQPLLRSLPHALVILADTVDCAGDGENARVDSNCEWCSVAACGQDPGSSCIDIEALDMTVLRKALRTNTAGRYAH
jgi:hypothetical protein